jgi:hypothetical protein
MVKIKITERVARAHVILVLLSIIAVVIGCYWFLYVSFYDDFGNEPLFQFLIYAIPLVFLVTPIALRPHWRQATDESDYISHFIISQNNLTILWKYGQTDIYPLSEIEAITVSGNYRIEFSQFSGETTLTVLLKNGESVIQEENSTNWGILKRMIDNAKSLPNFQYDLDGTIPEIKELINNYAKVGVLRYHVVIKRTGAEPTFWNKVNTDPKYMIPAVIVIVLISWGAVKATWLWAYHTPSPHSPYSFAELDAIREAVRSCKPHKNARPEEYLEYGTTRVRAEDYQEAIKCFNEAIKLDDNLKHAYFWLGVAKYNLQDKKGAEQAFMAHRAKVSECLRWDNCNRYDKEDAQKADNWLLHIRKK